MTTWVRRNRRIHGALIALTWGLAGIGFFGSRVLPGWLPGAAALAVSSGLFAVVSSMLLGWRMLCPRIACDGEDVRFFLARRESIRVPLTVIEAFFLGQGDHSVPGLPRESSYATYLIARLDQRRTEWANRECDLRLGRWCDGYIRINGAWTEPLKLETVSRVNRLLHEAQQRRADRASGPKNERA